jgi:hypothetical protein
MERRIQRVGRVLVNGLAGGLIAVGWVEGRRLLHVLLPAAPLTPGFAAVRWLFFTAPGWPLLKIVALLLGSGLGLTACWTRSEVLQQQAPSAGLRHGAWIGWRLLSGWLFGVFSWWMVWSLAATACGLVLLSPAPVGI